MRLALVIILALAGPALAGLQSWSVVYLDGAGQPTTYGNHASAEAWSEDQRGWQIGIGCVNDALALHLTAPSSQTPDFAGAQIEPSLRIGKPGTDLFLGPVGKMRFDGTRYTGPLPRPIFDAMLTDARDKQLTFTEFTSRTTILLKLQRVERIFAELPCA